MKVLNKLKKLFTISDEDTSWFSIVRALLFNSIFWETVFIIIVILFSR